MEFNLPNDPDEWKYQKEPLGKNDMDYTFSLTVNSHTKTPFLVNNWKINGDEAERVDICVRGTYFSLVLGDKPYLEIFKTDEFSQLLLPPEKVIELGEYFNK